MVRGRNAHQKLFDIDSVHERPTPSYCALVFSIPAQSIIPAVHSDKAIPDFAAISEYLEVIRLAFHQAPTPARAISHPAQKVAVLRKSSNPVS